MFLKVRHLSLVETSFVIANFYFAQQIIGLNENKHLEYRWDPLELYLECQFARHHFLSGEISSQFDKIVVFFRFQFRLAGDQFVFSHLNILTDNWEKKY